MEMYFISTWVLEIVKENLTEMHVGEKVKASCMSCFFSSLPVPPFFFLLFKSWSWHYAHLQ